MPIASSLEVQMLNLINAERAALGIAPLTLNARLNGSAENHSQWMLGADVFSHTGAGGSTVTDRIEQSGYALTGNWTAGENIVWQSERGAAGQSDDVVDLHRALMNSPGHRANILNPAFTEIGIGIEIGTYTTGGQDWPAVIATQNFAHSSADNGGPGGETGGEPVVPPPDLLTGTERANRLVGTEGVETIDGRGGNDWLEGLGGNDTIYGGAGKDKVYGGNDADWLSGGTGNDLILGGDGDDWLRGDAGKDKLYGDTGQDSFAFARGDGRDTVKDFQDNVDTLVFGGGLWDGGLSVEAFVDRFARDVGADVLFDFGGGQQVRLTGVSSIAQLYDDVTLIA